MRKMSRGMKKYLLLLELAVAVVAGPGCAGDALPTGTPKVTDDEIQKEASQALPEYMFTVENELYFEFAYKFETLTYRSANPEIAQAKFMEGEYDFKRSK